MAKFKVLSQIWSFGMLQYAQVYLSIYVYVNLYMHVENDNHINRIQKPCRSQSSLPSKLWQIGIQVWASGCRIGSGRSVC